VTSKYTLEVITVSANPSTSATNILAHRSGGLVWNRLHSEREAICEALLTEFRPTSQVQFPEQTAAAEDTANVNWHRELLQARLRKIDDALDRLMSGSYGNCSKCGRWIEDTKLEFDPAIAFCIECWQQLQTKH
jgi:RNA polymerase-binding transcription factor DksA